MALTNGPNLGLLINGLAGEEHYDELMAQWRGFDGLVQCTVLDRDLTAPPGSPANGAAYIPATGASGAWSGQAGKIARWSSTVSAWEFFTPHPGWRAHVVDEALNLTYIGSAWTAGTVAIAQGGTGAVTAGAARTALGLGTVATLDSDIDGTLAANSDAKVATQKAVKTYVDALISSSDVMVFKGVIDASGNPNYPAADAGHLYKISVAGKIGGASGPNVQIGDTIFCTVDATATGNQATVGANWAIVQVNIDGAVVGPVSVTDGVLALFDGTTGKLIKAGAVPPTGTNTGDQTITLTGDVTGSGTGSFAATLANDAVTNAKAANMATQTIKGRTTGSTGDPEDLTALQAAAVVQGDGSDVDLCGFRGIPQVSFSANTTVAASHNGKELFHPASDANARTVTIDSNASLALEVGHVTSITNDSANDVTIAITTDTLVWSPTGGTGSRTLAEFGCATIRKVGATRWYITGVGLT